MSYYTGNATSSSYNNSYGYQQQSSYGGGYNQNYQKPQIELPCPPNYSTNEYLPAQYVDGGYGQITRNYFQDIYANQTVGVKNNVTYTPHLNRQYVDQGTSYNVAPLQFTEGCMPPPPNFCPPAISFSCPPATCDYGGGYGGGYQQQNNYGGGGSLYGSMVAPGGASMYSAMFA
jgi:hypothetical protein